MTVVPMKIVVLVAVVSLAGCCSKPQPEKIALAPWPLSSPTSVAIPVRGTIVCDTGGAKVYQSYADVERSLGFGLNDSLTIKFSGRTFKLYSVTTLTMREVQ
jgi:hypothetical protein